MHKIAALVLLLIGSIRVTHVARTLTQTFDEPAKIAYGMRLLALGQYPYNTHHPPLGLTAAALGIYLEGIPLVEVTEDRVGLEHFYEEGNRLLYHEGNYRRNLALARLGILPFFLVLSVSVWLWARHGWGNTAGLFALILATTLPEVLAHSAIASDDLAIGATLTAALYSLTRWIESPTARRALALGVWTGLALASKMSAVVFLPAVALAYLAWHLASAEFTVPRVSLRTGLQLAGMLLTAVLVLWTAYFLDVTYITTEHARPHEMIHPYVGASGPIHDAAYWLAEKVPVPLSTYVQGVRNLFAHNDGGHPAYLLGLYSQRGWWYYFPVAFAAKSPVPFLALSLAAGIVLLVCSWRRRQATLALPVIGATIVMAISMFSGINIGLRHVLPVFPLLAIASGAILAILWSKPTPRRLTAAARRTLVVLLLGYQLVSTALAHPDYLAYFNELVPRPEAVLVDSNLDWGQDLYRLERELRRRNVRSVWIDYFGTADLQQHDLPPWKLLRPGRAVRGWVAISETQYQGVYTGGPAGYAWLDRYEPAAWIGRSMRLYWIP